MRDIDAVLAPRPFNARVHCTKSSRNRATLWGLLLGASLGLLIGVTLTWVLPGLGGRQIVYVEAPDKPSVESQTPDRPRTASGIRARRRDDRTRGTDWRSHVGNRPADRRDARNSVGRSTSRNTRAANTSTAASSPPDTFRPDQSLILLKRELLETYQ